MNSADRSETLISRRLAPRMSELIAFEAAARRYCARAIRS